jgi:hypothetical protein
LLENRGAAHTHAQKKQNKKLIKINKQKVKKTHTTISCAEEYTLSS